MFVLLVPFSANTTANAQAGAISVPEAAASAQHALAGPAGARVVSYNGVQVRVPASWPVIDLRLHPRTCVRLDQAAAYLGSPGPQTDCPAHAVGRADTIWLRPLSALSMDPVASHDATVGALAARVDVDLVGHDAQAQFVAQSVSLEATWGNDSSTVNTVLATAAPSSASSTVAPAAQLLTTTATSPSPVATAARQLVATGSPAIATASTFTGMAFDACGAPSASTMSSWLASPYRAVGIYLGGSMRACGDGNLSASWVSQVRAMGWGLLPIYVGIQAPCVNQGGLATINASTAAAQGISSADDAVSRAQFFGLSSGAPIYYDMEAYNTSAAGCSQAVMTFISAWTRELHRLGYSSGAYGSSSSLMTDMSTFAGSSGFTAPDNVWFAHWNQLQNTSDASSYPRFPDVGWSNHQRVHQYSGGLTQSWGGASINVDANWVDAAVAGAAVPVDYGTNVTGPGGRGFVFTGAMTYWRSSAPAGLKKLAYWTYSNGSTEANGATWSPQLSPGVYNVRANIPSAGSTANAHYTIRSAGGTTSKWVNQQSVKGYTSLGTYTSRAGSSITVHVGDDSSPTTTQIGVDAMAFQLVGNLPSPPGAVSAVAGSGHAVVSWGAASGNGSPVTGYTVTSSPGGRTATTAGATATVTGLTDGTGYTFAVTATSSVGTSASSAASAPVIPAVDTRLAGADRYITAAAISQSAFPQKVTGQQWVVTVASGANFPDALAAGPVAAASGGPLLLVPKDGALPAAVSAELTRLNPSRVDIAGGVAAVSSAVEGQLKAFGAGSVLRVAGPDRYATAAQLAGITNGGLSKTVFIATGASFPDALGGSAAAARLGGALLLTDRYALPAATAAALTAGKPTKVVLLGGVTVVDPAILSKVHTLLPGTLVERWAGADRYATAAVISSKTYPTGAATAFLASGASYPDALAGGPVAAHAGAPLLLTGAACIPASTFAELIRLHATRVVVLGGTSAVSDAAAHLTGCRG